MAFNYQRMQNTAQQLLQSFGQQLTFTRTASGSYDPDTGTTSTTESTFAKYACVFDYTDTERADETIQEGDRRVLAESGDYQVGDKVDIDGETYRVLTVSETSPASTIVSVGMQVRK